MYYTQVVTDTIISDVWKFTAKLCKVENVCVNEFNNRKFT